MYDGTQASVPFSVSQMLGEERWRPLPREFGGGFVVAWSCVVVESVVGSLVHVHRVVDVVGVECGLVLGPNGVSVTSQRRRPVVCGCLIASREASESPLPT